MASTLACPPQITFIPRPTDRHLIFDSKKSICEKVAGKGIEALAKEIQASSGLIATGRLGPAFYKDEPSRLDHIIQNQAFYGWTNPETGWPDEQSLTEKTCPNKSVIVLGAGTFQFMDVEDKIINLDLVFFTYSQDITGYDKEGLRVHRPSSLDTRMFAISHKTFLSHVDTIHELLETKITISDNTSSLFSPGVEAFLSHYMEKLKLVDVNNTKTRAQQVVNIGMEIFSTFKSIGVTDSSNDNTKCSLKMMSTTFQKLQEQTNTQAGPLQAKHDLLLQLTSFAWTVIGENGLYWIPPTK